MKLRTLNEIVKNIIDDIHDKLPNVDTKEGTFIRDVFINPGASQIFQLYQDAKMIEYSQSILTATGEELDKLAQNYFVTRKGASKSYGKLRFYLGDQVPSEIITILKGSTAYTRATDNRVEIYFETLVTVTVIPEDISSYSYDSTEGQYYVEVEASSVDTGSINNVGAKEITVLGEGLDSVTKVINPFAFSGGTDAESDTSLMLRVSMAITGSNIGTKDGYNSFILKQEGVIDAKVVGAGEPLMTRDNGEGGMVDIYVRAEKLAEAEYIFNVDYSYITHNQEKPAYSDIVLPKQPVVSIGSIVGKRSGFQEPIVYLNGSDYYKENGSDRFYYAEVEWTFLEPEGQSQEDYAIRYFNERLAEVNYLTDLKYGLDWSTIKDSLDNDTVSLPLDPYFDRGFYSDGLIYMIRAKDDQMNPYIGGRCFVKKDGKIYERIYVNPDFILVKDNSDYGYSIKGKDCIRWLDPANGAKRPIENEVLTISYNWNEKIEDLQNRVEEKRVLTADVLVKQARSVPIEIKMNVVPYPEFDPEEVRVSVINKITNFINNVKELGSTIDRAGIIAIVRITGGVKSVDIESIYLARVGEMPEKELSVEGFEYFVLDNIVVNMLDSNTIV
jgi:Uncharacterized homolog of phage Mu protein gp47